MIDELELVFADGVLTTENLVILILIVFLILLGLKLADRI